MNIAIKVLRDDAARRDAISAHNRSFLVEAGAGSGKTAVMAGRIAAMLAEGIAPKSIAAVTFTELAASELLIRVRDFVSDLAAGTIPTELRIAYPAGLSKDQTANLAAALNAIDEVTCSTIHGFCQRLIKSYPVEADIDPGASVMDHNHADFAFLEIVETWLREQLSRSEAGTIAEMVIQSPGETVALIHKIVANLRKRRTLSAPPVTPLAPHLDRFRDSTNAFADFISGAPAVEPETKECAHRFAEMAAALVDASQPETSVGLVRLLASVPHRDLCTKSGTFLAFKKKGKWVEAAKRAGLAKADAERLHTAAETHYAACCDAWHAMLENVASRVLSDLITRAQPVLKRFRDYKRSAALLDFDDLIFAARDLLRDHDDVRRALAARPLCPCVGRRIPGYRSVASGDLLAAMR
jgi:ATP-dependent exoDNAse (exonuclease V) beta subunit